MGAWFCDTPVIHYVWFLSICVTRHLHDGLESCSLRNADVFPAVTGSADDKRQPEIRLRSQAKRAVVMVKKWLISGNLAIWTVYVFVLYQCLLVPRGINSRFCGKTQWQMFLLVSGRQHIVSIQISINSGKKNFSAISHIYLLSLPRFWTLSIESVWFAFWSILNGMTLKTSNTFTGHISTG